MLDRKILKRAITFLMVITLVMSMQTFRLPVKAQGVIVGDGTPTEPYQITTAAELAEIVNSAAESKSYVLMNDIDLSSFANWTPIGNGSNQFNGMFDGNGHVINNLSRSTAIDTMGLFGVISETGTVKNLTLTGTNVTGGSKTGSIAGENYGMVSNCNSGGSLKGSEYVGGIAGLNVGSVLDCSNSATVEGSSMKIGGIVGHSAGKTSRCLNIGKVISTGSSVGGIVGFNCDDYGKWAEISNCYNKGSVSGYSQVGGIAGQSMLEKKIGVSITRCYNTAVISTVTGSVGGIAGNNYSFEKGISYCASLAENIVGNGWCNRISGGDVLFTGVTTHNIYQNYGYKYMKQSGNSITWDSDKNGLNGLDLDGTLLSNNTWLISAWLWFDPNIWIIENQGQPTLKNITLKAQVPAFADSDYGTQPEVQGVSITNGGSVDVTITGVTLQDGTDFSINTTGEFNISAGYTNNTHFTVSPKANLAIGTYSDTILIAYKDASGSDQTARAAVSYTVTDPMRVTSVTVKTAPAKTTYTAGNLLDLCGLVVTLHKHNGSHEDVAFENLAAKGISTSPANGAALKKTSTTVTITYASSGNSIQQGITVNLHVYDGVDVTALSKPGNGIYYGTYQHATELVNTQFGAVTSREENPTPILWQVMGEELNDGDITLLSKYVLDSQLFPSASTGDNYYNNSSIRTWLNSSFLDNFKGIEQASMDSVNVETGMYDLQTGNPITGIYKTPGDQYTYTDKPLPWVTNNDKVYLPWGNGYAGKVSWTAGNDISLGSLGDSATTLKNGKIVHWLLRSPNYYKSYYGLIVLVDGKITVGLLTYEFGVRPAFKLKPSEVVFMSEIVASDEDGMGKINAVTDNYAIADTEFKNFKLTLEDSSSGNTLTGVPTGTQTVVKGNDMKLSNLISSKTGSEYTINYKIVGNNSAGNREIMAYGHTAAGTNLTLDSDKLETGNYDAYVWLQKNNEIASNEASALQHFDLTVNPTSKPATPDPAKPEPAPLESATPAPVTPMPVTPAPVNTAILVSKITLDKTALSLAKGETTTLKATIAPQNAKNQALSWSSSDTNVATAAANGSITAKNYGTAKITATAQDKSGVSVTCNLTVGYRIRYLLNGGENNASNPSSYYKSAVTLQAPTRKGYLFKDWYTDKNYKNKITSIKKGTKKNYTLYAKWEKVNVSKTKINNLQHLKSKQLTIKLKKVSGAKGYEIVYATDSKFTKGKETILVSGVNTTIKGLKKGKTNYVKVRSYKTDSTKNKVYGTYSSVKKLKL